MGAISLVKVGGLDSGVGLLHPHSARVSEPARVAERKDLWVNSQLPTSNSQGTFFEGFSLGVGSWTLGVDGERSYRAASVAGALMACGFSSAFVIPSAHLIASRYICWTSRMSQVAEECANEP